MVLFGGLNITFCGGQVSLGDRDLILPSSCMISIPATVVARIGAHGASSRVTEQSPAHIQKKSYLVTLVVEIVLSGGCSLVGINIETQGFTCYVSLLP